MVHCIVMGDHQECASLKENDLISLDSLAEQLQTHLKLFNIWKQDAHNLGPSFVKSLVPDASFEALSLVFEVR